MYRFPKSQPLQQPQQPPAPAPRRMPGQPGTLSRWVARLARLVLGPVILAAVPAWPVLALSCAVPFLSLLTIPAFIALSVILLYALAWYTYLVLAQADAQVQGGGPSDGSSATAHRWLPLLPLSPLKCARVTWAAIQYALCAAQLALPTLLDWSYRRVMVLGTAAGSAIVKEGILYGSASPGKRLDVYLPPARRGGGGGDMPSASASARPAAARHRKHSTLFEEPPPAVRPDGTPVLDEDDEAAEGGPAARPATPRPRSRGAPVIVFLPSPLPPLNLPSKRKSYLQLALRLRRMGNCVVVPDITYFPESRIRQSVTDVRLVLRWVGDHIARYGGDPDRIHLMGHGLSAHLALLTLTQEAVVLSREGALEAQAHSEEQEAAAAAAAAAAATDDDADDELDQARGSASPPRKTKVPGTAHAAAGELPRQSTRRARHHAAHSSGDAWVDDPAALAEGGGVGVDVDVDVDAEVEGLPFPPATRAAPPGAVMPSTAPGHYGTVGRAASVQLTRRMSEAATSQQQTAVPFPSSSSTPAAPGAITIPNGLRRVQLYAPSVSLPPIAGLILFSGPSDVIKSFRHSALQGLSDLSVLRRSAGPGHTACLLHSPAHLLYAGKNLLDAALLPPKVLLVHGGEDSVVPIEQSTLLKTLLVGVGVGHVRLRAYRHLGHVESLACLFLGVGKGWRRYTRMVCQDLEDILAA